MKRILTGVAVLCATGGLALAAAGTAFAAGPPAQGGQTNLSATVETSFVVTGFPTAVDFASVAPGATTAGTASPYQILTNNADGWSATVGIDPADENNDYNSNLGRGADILRGPGSSYIPLTADNGGLLTVQHADTAGPLGPVQTLPNDQSGVVTVADTSGPDNGAEMYEDQFQLAIPGGDQPSGTYTGQLDYVIFLNP